MDAEHDTDVALCTVAAAIGEPARARILLSLMDGHARTSTELSVVAGVSPSTASVHLDRLRSARLINVIMQGKHRFYRLEGPAVADALEELSVLGGSSPKEFVPTTPGRLCDARTCYDHLAGRAGVSLHNRFRALDWLSADSKAGKNAYDLTPKGTKALESLGINIEATRGLRRRFAYGCLDWSERSPHLGGALGAALLKIALQRKWLAQELDSRALAITSLGRREMLARFGLQV